MEFVFQLVKSAADGFWLLLDILRTFAVLNKSQLLILQKTFGIFGE